MDVSIIITNFHTHTYTEVCINSLLLHVQGLNYEIILVENGSAEFNPKNVKHWGNRIKLVVTEKNLGFAGGNNLGIRHAEGKYIILLNSDTYLQDNAVLKTFRYIENHPEVGVLSCRLVYPDGKIQSAAQRFPSVKYGLFELLRLQKFMSRKKAGKILLGAFFDNRETVKADWVWGTYFMFPRRILALLPENKLDDDYSMYCEDMQWCMDIVKTGYEIHFFAGAEIVHLMGGSSVARTDVSAAAKKNLIKKHHEIFMRRNYHSFTARLIKIINHLLVQ